MAGPSNTDLNTNERVTVLTSSQQPNKDQISDGVYFCLLTAPCEINTKGWKLNNTTPMIVLFPSDHPLHIKGKYLALHLSENDFLSLLLNPLYLKAPGKAVELSTSERYKEWFYQVKNERSLENFRSIFHRIAPENSTALDLLDKEMALLSLLIKLKNLPALGKIDLRKSFDEKQRVWSIDDLTDHIRSHFDNPLSLEGMASQCALNASYLSRSFKKKTGTTIFAYLNRIRIEKACILLKNSSMTITEIAFSVGYNNISFFNRMFKRTMAVTPGEYRRKLRF